MLRAENFYQNPDDLRCKSLFLPLNFKKVRCQEYLQGCKVQEPPI